MLTDARPLSAGLLEERAKRSGMIGGGLVTVRCSQVMTIECDGESDDQTGLTDLDAAASQRQ